MWHSAVHPPPSLPPPRMLAPLAHRFIKVLQGNAYIYTRIHTHCSHIADHTQKNVGGASRAMRQPTQVKVKKERELGGATGNPVVQTNEWGRGRGRGDYDSQLVGYTSHVAHPRPTHPTPPLPIPSQAKPYPTPPHPIPSQA
jgi:hypothetical protein